MSTSYCNVLSLFRIVYHKECDIVYENQFGVISKSLVFGVVVNRIQVIRNFLPISNFFY